MIGNKSAFILCTQLALLGAEGMNDPVDVTVAPRVESILPGEPLVVDVTLGNGTKGPLAVDLGMDGIEAFTFAVESSDGRTVCSSEPIRRFGLTRSGRVELKPGGRRSLPLVVNEWCPLLLPAGRYTITVRIRTRARGDAVLVGSSAGFTIDVLPADDAKLAERLNTLKTSALGREDGGAEQRLHRTMLFNTKSPAAAKPLGEIATAARDDLLRTEAVEALGRIPTKDSVAILSEIAFSEPKDSRIHQLAVNMVYSIQDTADDPEIKQACRRVVMTYERRPMAVTID